MTEKAETIHTEQTGIKEYNPIAAEISKLVDDKKNKVYNPETTEGMKELTTDCALFRKIRTGVEKIRKALKADHLEAGRKIDREAKRLTAMAEVGEAPLIEMVTAQKEKKAKAKAERERLELERVQKIQGLISKIRTPLPHGIAKSRVIDCLDWLHGLDIVPEFYQEFTLEALEAREQAVTNADGVLASIIAAEEQAAELERLRVESERRDKEEAERKAKEEADRKADEPDLPERKEVVPIPERTERSVDRDDPGQAYQCPEHGGLLSDQLEEASPPETEVPETKGPSAGTIPAQSGTVDHGDGTVEVGFDPAGISDEMMQAAMPETVEQTPTAAGERTLAENQEQQRALSAASRIARGLPGEDAQEPAGADTGEDRHRDILEVDELAKARCFMVLRTDASGRWLDIATASSTAEAANTKGDILDINRPAPEGEKRYVVPVSCWEVV